MTMYSVFVGIPRDISLDGQSWIVNRREVSPPSILSDKLEQALGKVTKHRKVSVESVCKALDVTGPPRNLLHLLSGRLHSETAKKPEVSTFGNDFSFLDTFSEKDI